MIRAIFFDIDGTLLSHRRGEVPPDARAALRALADKGILVFVSTGRHMQEINELPVRDIAFDGYVLLNGQICLDSARKRVFANPICPADVARMQTIFDEMEIPVLFVEEEQRYVNFSNERIAAVHQAFFTKVPPIGRHTGGAIYQIAIFTDAPRAEAIIKTLESSRMIQWNPYGFDILPESEGKATGMRWLLEHYGLSRTEIMAFGDGNNDADMLRYAGIGVAMGNGEAIAKENADYVTGDIDEGGIVQALMHYGIL